MAGIRRPGVDESDILYWLINLAINIEWTIPAWICLVLHFVIGLHIKWFLILLGAWLIVVTLAYFLLTKLMSMDYSGATHVTRTPEEQAEHDRRIREISRSVGEKNKR